MNKLTKDIITYLSICVNCFLISYLYYSNESKHVILPPIAKRTEVVEVPKYMDDWEMFTMALMTVESKLDSTAISSKGAKGYLQITPIYVEEVNRIHGTNFTMNDVLELETAYEIFDLMQQAHNQDYDIEKAIVLHNGKHVWYRKRIMDALENIKKYENIRNRLIEIRPNQL